MIVAIATSKKWYQGHKYALMVLNGGGNTNVYVFVANAINTQTVEGLEIEEAFLVGDVWVEIPDIVNRKSTYMYAGTDPIKAVEAALEWQKAEGYLCKDSLTIHTTAYGTWIGKNQKVIDLISKEVGQQVKIKAITKGLR